MFMGVGKLGNPLGLGPREREFESRRPDWLVILQPKEVILMARGRRGGRKSSLSAKTNRRRNTKAGRRAMSPSQFGLPSKKKYRIDDAAHARNALARVAQHGTPAEKAQVRAAVHRKFPSIQQSK